MSDSSSRIKNIFFFLSLLVVFVSCSQVSPELNFSTGSVIFEYENDEDLPSVRLSVFLDMSSDEHRAESIKLESLSRGYEWEATAPLKFENGNRKYTGYTNFVMPGTESFPQGQYRVTYIDANDETAVSTLNLSYSQDVSTMKSDEATSYMRTLTASENWAVYSEDEILVFFGQKQGDTYDIGSVWRKYAEADFARTIWVSPGSRTICIMPRVYKSKAEESN